MQPQMLSAVLSAFLGPIIGQWWLAHFPSMPLDSFIGATVVYFFTYIVPAGSLLLAGWKTRKAGQIASTSKLVGVAHVAMDTESGAADIGAPGDKVLGPSETIAAVAAKPDVKAVVMYTESKAKSLPSSPSAAILGPSALKAA